MGGVGGRGAGSPREDRNVSGANRRGFDESRREGRGGGARREFDGGRRELDGNRRGGFGGGNRGKNRRGDRAPNVEDESDFPSLGSGSV